MAAQIGPANIAELLATVASDIESSGTETVRARRRAQLRVARAVLREAIEGGKLSAIRLDRVDEALRAELFRRGG